MRLSRPFSKRRFQEDGGVIAGSFPGDWRAARSQEMARLAGRLENLRKRALRALAQARFPRDAR